jgi:hypothetical protein
VLIFCLEELIDPAIDEFITGHYPGCQRKVLCELGTDSIVIE